MSFRNFFKLFEKHYEGQDNQDLDYDNRNHKIFACSTTVKEGPNHRDYHYDNNTPVAQHIFNVAENSSLVPVADHTRDTEGEKTTQYDSVFNAIYSLIFTNRPSDISDQHHHDEQEQIQQQRESEDIKFHLLRAIIDELGITTKCLRTKRRVLYPLRDPCYRIYQCMVDSQASNYRPSFITSKNKRTRDKMSNKNKTHVRNIRIRLVEYMRDAKAKRRVGNVYTTRKEILYKSFKRQPVNAHHHRHCVRPSQE